MYENYWELSKTWIIYSILVIYLMVSPVSSMLSIMGILPSVPWIYLILMLLIIYLVLKIFQLLDTRFTRAVDIYYMIGVALLAYVIYALLVSGSMLMHKLPDQTATIRTLLASTTILFTFFFIIGGKLADLNNLLQKKKVRILTILFYLAYCAAIYWTAITLNAANTVEVNTLITLDARFNYLFISDTFAIFTFIVLWMVVQSTTFRWVIALNSMTLLYITRSRTVFFLFIFCLFIALIIQAKNKKNWLVAGCSIALFFLLGGSDLIFNNQTGIIFSLVFNASSDESYLARQQLWLTGLKDLQDYWLLGLPMAEVWNGNAGGYLHNYLSFWVCFGIVPFAGFVALSINCFGKLITLMKKNHRDSLTIFLVIYFVFAYIEIISSRAYIYPYVWACLSAVPVIYNQHFVNKDVFIDEFKSC